jgi:multiple antibiotic resistance protein
MQQEAQLSFNYGMGLGSDPKTTERYHGVNENGMLSTAIALVLNIFIAGLVFRSSESLQRSLGQPGTKTVSKIASLLLASIAVMIVRKGLESFIFGRGPG